MIFHLPSLLVVVLALASMPALASNEEPEGEPVWIEQHAKSADHAFQVQFLPFDGDRTRTSKAIRVVNRKTGAVVQEIAPVEGNDSRDAAKFLTLVDANRDGHPDIEMFIDSGGAGPNSTSHFYLFDPQTRQFRFHQQLSELTQVTVDPDGLITWAQRGSCCSYGGGTYRFIRGKLTMLTTRDESMSPDGKWVRISVGTVRNGKMRYSSSRRRMPPQD